MTARRSPFVAVTVAVTIALLHGCAGIGDDAPPRRSPEAQAPRQAARVDQAQVDRLRRILPPVVAAMDKPVPLEQVKVTVLADDAINAANGGGGFFATHPATGDRIEAIRSMP